MEDIGVDEIKAVEKFVKHDLVALLGELFQPQLEQCELVHFFGRFWKNPQTFTIMPGEQKCILAVGKYIKQTISRNGIRTFIPSDNFAGYQYTEYFKPKDAGNSEGTTVEQQLKDDPKLCSMSQSDTKSQTHIILDLLRQQADVNVGRSKNGYRFSTEIKKFATFYRMIAGKLAYQTLQQNLSLALPSIITTNRSIQASNFQVTEGILRSKELLCHLEKNNLPLIVALSEDATRIDGKIEYDRKSNQIVGFVLPTNEKTGMPVPFSFPARNSEEIVQHFSRQNPVASFVNVIMAQPIAEKHVPAFCLLIFGSDNKYTSRDVRNRWNFITNELAALQIKVLTISSDSDPRYNSCMRNQSLLGCSEKIGDLDWFNCGISNDKKITRPFYVQDTIHIATKMRNYLLNHGDKIPFGRYGFIQINHLKQLINDFPKDHHNLTPYTLNPTDKQNFVSAQRMCSEKVTDLLLKSVPESEATAKFLEIIRFIIDSYMSTTLTPLERVSKMWYALFMIRIWRRFIKRKKDCCSKNNFLTMNCYSCIELNSHSLVLLMIYLRKCKLPHLFKPYEYESQPCEKEFRQIRSFTSTYSTVANCSVKEILNRISKIELQNEIASDADDLFKYLRMGNNKSVHVSFDLPPLSAIYETIELAKQNAINDAFNLGMLKSVDTEGVVACLIQPLILKVIKNRRGQKEMSGEEMKKNETKVGTNLLTDYSKNIDVERIETSPYVKVTRIDGTVAYVLKRSLCWLLRPDFQKLSADRLLRVRQNVDPKTKKQKNRKEILENN